MIGSFKKAGYQSRERKLNTLIAFIPPNNEEVIQLNTKKTNVTVKWYLSLSNKYTNNWMSKKYVLFYLT